PYRGPSWGQQPRRPAHGDGHAGRRRGRADRLRAAGRSAGGPPGGLSAEPETQRGRPRRGRIIAMNAPPHPRPSKGPSEAGARGARGAPPHRWTAVLLGNPNTGKTTLFNALSGLNHRVGNYPGVTVETKKGHMTCAGQPFELIDLPGTYSLAPRSPDEMVAVDVILGHQPGEVRPDVVVSIV